jgi:hypothetical protein
MADAPRYRTLVETPEYEAQLESLAQTYSDETLEASLLGLLWGIATNPEKFDKVTWSIYVAKSRSFDAGPCFRVFFQIIDENKVLLLWIEEIGGTEEILEL